MSNAKPQPGWNRCTKLNHIASKKVQGMGNILSVGQQPPIGDKPTTPTSCRMPVKKPGPTIGVKSCQKSIAGVSQALPDKTPKVRKQASQVKDPSLVKPDLDTWIVFGSNMDAALDNMTDLLATVAESVYDIELSEDTIPVQDIIINNVESRPGSHKSTLEEEDDEESSDDTRAESEVGIAIGKLLKVFLNWEVLTFGGESFYVRK